MKISLFSSLAVGTLIALSSITISAAQADTLCQKKGAVKAISGTRCTSPYKAVTLTSASVKGAVGVQGAKGDKGDTGATGATGSLGAKGDTGSVGPVGAKGDKGDKGDAGPAGTFSMQSFAALCTTKSITLKASTLVSSSNGYSNAFENISCQSHEYIAAFDTKKNYNSGEVIFDRGRDDNTVNQQVAANVIDIQWYAIPDVSKATAQLTLTTSCCPLNTVTGLAQAPVYEGTVNQ